MLVDNVVEGDSRVQKQARSAAERGWDVILLGKSPDKKPHRWKVGEARVRLVPVPTPLTRIRLRPPEPSAPERWIATSRTSEPTVPSTRARSRPHRISSPSELVRCERPQPSSAIASRRLVLPAAFGPQIRCGPASKEASTDA